MATTCIVLGQSPVVKEKNPIVFTRVLETNKKITLAFRSEPGHFNYIELICLGYNNKESTANKFDLMFAYQHPNEREDGVLFIGQWNDGIV